jgi:excinuclease ABC subunit B
VSDQLESVRQEMFAAAENLEFEKAARLRDQIRLLKGGDSDDAASPRAVSKPKARAAGGGRGASRGGGRGRGGGRYR